MCQVYTCKYTSIAIPKTIHFVDKKRKSYSMKNKERQRKWMTAESWRDLVDRINRKESLLDFRQVKTMTFDRRLCKKESPRDPFPYDFNKLHAKQRVEFKGERRFTLPKSQEIEEKRSKVSQWAWILTLFSLLFGSPRRLPIDWRTIERSCQNHWLHLQNPYITLTF